MVDDLEYPQPLVGQLHQQDEPHQDGQLRSKEDNGRPRDPDETAMLLEKPEPKTQQGCQEIKINVTKPLLSKSLMSQKKTGY